MSNVSIKQKECFVKTLQGLGYTAYQVKRYEVFYRKNIDGKFYLNFNFYDYSHMPNVPFDYGVEARVQFNSNDKTFSVKLLDCLDIESTEDFFKNIFITMNCTPYW